MEGEEIIPQESRLPEFKKTVLRVGTYVMICFILRYICGVVIALADSAMYGRVELSLSYIIKLSISGTFLQILPSVIGAFMFGLAGKNGTGIKRLYKKPARFSKAVSNFAPVYGICQTVNIITLIAVFVFSNKADFGKTINTTLNDIPLDMATSVFMMLLLVVIAPVFEEFMFRGLILGALKPYGNGFAIITSGLLFGLFHGNFRQFFYTAAMGIAVGYIADVTGSILPTTIIHAVINGISGIMIIIMSTDGVKTMMTAGGTDSLTDTQMISVAVFGIYMVAILIFMAVGFIAAVIKMKQIKRFKVPKVWTEISNGRKAALLICTVPAIISVIMIADTFLGFSDSLLTALFG